MNNELAQVVALVAHGTAFLTSGVTPPDVLALPSFNFTRAMTFQRDTGPNGILPGPEAWIRDLGTRGAKRLEVQMFRRSGALTPYDAVAFANGGNWAIHDVARPWGDEWWIGRSAFDKARDPDRPWSTVFGNNSREPGEAIPIGPLTDARAALASAVYAAVAFDEDTGGSEWRSRSFTPALAALHSDSPALAYGYDLLPKQGYSIEARQTLAAASHAWVFGGMGWWNDRSFSDPSVQTGFVTVTSALYDAVTLAVAAAANSYNADIT